MKPADIIDNKVIIKVEIPPEDAGQFIFGPNAVVKTHPVGTLKNRMKTDVVKEDTKPKQTASKPTFKTDCGKTYKSKSGYTKHIKSCDKCKSK